MNEIDYARERNKLVPIAQSYANAIHGTIPPESEEARIMWNDAWSKTYHEKMNLLAREKGLLTKLF